ncbi:MAG: phosphatase PAP2 family protein, partial [Parachlamydiales bacterium]|nr:phosphatase PAP2 family protein [Parachlamydiales bacterium]
KTFNFISPPVKDKKNYIQYNWRQFFSLTIAAVIIFGSWLYPPTRYYWDQIDVFIFRSLNDTLKVSATLQNFIAIFSRRSADIIFDIIMLAITFTYALWNKGQRKERLIKILFMAIYILVIIQILNRLLIKIGLDLHYRQSPTMVLPDSLWLSKLLNDPMIRDHSSNSFPGDHALSFLLWASMMWNLYGRRIGQIAWVFAILFCLPRLFTGAHWFTDDFVGSGCLTLLANAIAFGLPVAQIFVYYLLKIFSSKSKY